MAKSFKKSKAKFSWPPVQSKDLTHIRDTVSERLVTLNARVIRSVAIHDIDFAVAIAVAGKCNPAVEA